MSNESGRRAFFAIDSRVLRLIRKELSSILRDRRTIITLILMPVLLYPLLIIAFQQFFLAGDLENQKLYFVVGVLDRRTERELYSALTFGENQRMALARREEGAEPETWLGRHFGPRIVDSFAPAIEKGQITLGVELSWVRTAGNQVIWQVSMTVPRDSTAATEAAYRVETLLRYANETVLAGELSKIPNLRRLPQRVVVSTSIVGGEKDKSLFALLSALIPLILILMTITGAVYPAIDLTAGERERGTLEILVAAPLPCMGLLFAKYVSVLAVAVLTAVVNLGTMAVSLSITGLGKAVLGDHLSWGLLIQMFLLLVLFAAFFSAILLAVTSFARSFKEAQVYLIPLMLLSLTPGMLSLLPWVKLEGGLLIVPLLNLVLLARELLVSPVPIGITAIVILSTLLYAMCAILIAARIFGAEAVLYNEQGTWGDLFRRPRSEQAHPSLSAIIILLVILFPLTFLLMNLAGGNQALSLPGKLSIEALGSLLLLVVIPFLVLSWGRVRILPAFRLKRSALSAWPVAALLGISMWAVVSEIVVLQQEVGLKGLPDSVMIKMEAQMESLRSLPAVLVILLAGVIPAICEELFFRGVLLTALQTKYRNQSSILISAALFAAFHLLMPVGLAIERFLPSFLMGCLLGWIAVKTRSVVPGIILHSIHNTSVFLLIYLKQFLMDLGWNSEKQKHLPLSWFLIALGVAIGALLIFMITSRNLNASRVSDQKSDQ